MIPKIKMVEPMPDYKLKVLFDDGRKQNLRLLE